jgi:hypothetical protein
MSKQPSVRALRAMLVASGVALSSVANAACYPASAKLPDVQIQAFLQNPGELLSVYENGVGNLVGVIRDLVASDNATLPVVIQLLASANPQQRAAIGSGLGIAARICLIPEQAYAGQIQASLAETADTVALTAFVGSAGQVTGTSATIEALTAFVETAGQRTGTSRLTGEVNPITGGSGRVFSPFIFSGGLITSRGSTTRSTVSQPVSP